MVSLLICWGGVVLCCSVLCFMLCWFVRVVMGYW